MTRWYDSLWARLAILLVGCAIAYKGHSAVLTQALTCAGAKHNTAYVPCTVPIVITAANPNEVLVWCPAAVALGSTAPCPGALFYREGYLQGYSKILTVLGWQRFDAVTLSPGTTPPPTACVPPPVQPVTALWTVCPNGAGTFPQHRLATTSCDGTQTTYGEWLPVAPTAESCIAPFHASLTATPGVVTRGSSATLTWGVDDPLAQCVSPSGASNQGSLTVTPLTSVHYDLTCSHGYLSSTVGIEITVIAVPLFAHRCSPYPATKLTAITPLPTGVSTRYTSLVIQDCVLPGGGRIVEGIFTGDAPAAFVIPATWLDVQPTATEAEYGHAQVVAYKSTHP